MKNSPRKITKVMRIKSKNILHVKNWRNPAQEIQVIQQKKHHPEKAFEAPRENRESKKTRSKIWWFPKTSGQIYNKIDSMIY